MNTLCERAPVAVLAVWVALVPCRAFAEEPVEYCVSGAVRDDYGRPIKDAKVWIYRSTNGEYEETHTDKNGLFRKNIPWPPKEIDYIKATKSQYVPNDVDALDTSLLSKACQETPVILGIVVLQLIPSQDLKSRTVQENLRRAFEHSPSREVRSSLYLDTRLVAESKYGSPKRDVELSAAGCGLPCSLPCAPVYCTPRSNVPLIDRGCLSNSVQRTCYVQRAYCDPCPPTVCRYQPIVVTECQPRAPTQCGRQIEQGVQELNKLLDWMEQKLKAESAMVPSRLSKASADAIRIQQPKRDEGKPKASSVSKSTPVHVEWSPLILRDDVSLVRR